MVSNGARLILDECRDKCINTGKTFKNLPDLAVIQINDTHPTMVIPELIRLLTENGDIDGSPITMDEAIDIVSKAVRILITQSLPKPLKNGLWTILTGLCHSLCRL